LAQALEEHPGQPLLGRGWGSSRGCLRRQRLAAGKTMSKSRVGVISKDETRRIEDETRRMEMKLEMLRKTLDTQDAEKKGQGASRWKAADAKKPLTRGYANQVLQSKGGESKRAPTRRPSGGTPTTELQAEVTSRSPLATALSANPSAEEPRQTGAGVVCQAAANLQAAISQQSSEASEVEAFLTGIGLDRYNSLFLEHGFDCMEVVLEMQESHMQDIGMSPGHIIKLRKRLAELNPPAIAPAAKAPAGTSLAGSRRNVTWGATEAAQVSAASADGVACGGNLLDGTYDEAEAAASFQEAVMAWRRQGQSNTGEDGANKAQVPAGPGSFWSSIGGSEMDLIRASTPTQPPAEAAAALTESEIQHDAAPSEEKLCCYQCYKQFYAKYAVERQSPLPDADAERKRLCSEACADAWVKAVESKAEALRKRREKLEMMEERARALAEGDSPQQPQPVAA